MDKIPTTDDSKILDQLRDFVYEVNNARQVIQRLTKVAHDILKYVPDVDQNKLDLAEFTKGLRYQEAIEEISLKSGMSLSSSKILLRNYVKKGVISKFGKHRSDEVRYFLVENPKDRWDRILGVNPPEMKDPMFWKDLVVMMEKEYSITNKESIDLLGHWFKQGVLVRSEINRTMFSFK